MKLNSIKLAAANLTGKTGLVVKRYSPEILIGIGVVTGITSTVMACKATLRSDIVIDNARLKLDSIKEAREVASEDEYSKADQGRDLAITYFQTALEFGKLYGPSIAMGAFSVACFVGSHHILRKRNLALVAAYKGISEGFKRYRDRVIEEFGEDKDFEFRTGMRKETIKVKETDPETGKTKTVKEEVYKINGNEVSDYARFFDETCDQWSKTPEYNLMFLRSNQQYANDILNSRGHLFLNEVYTMLGMPHTQAGSVVGWTLNSEGDGYVDFGIYEFDNDTKRRFVNGEERSILLDFNVDGVIFDLI